MHSIFKINSVYPTVKHNVHTKFKLNRMHRVHSHSYMHAYITVKIAQMNSRDLKTYKWAKISKSKIFYDYNIFLTQYRVTSTKISYTMIYVKVQLNIKFDEIQCIIFRVTVFIILFVTGKHFPKIAHVQENQKCVNSSKIGRYKILRKEYFRLLTQKKKK